MISVRRLDGGSVTVVFADLAIVGSDIGGVDNMDNGQRDESRSTAANPQGACTCLKVTSSNVYRLLIDLDPGIMSISAR